MKIIKNFEDDNLSVEIKTIKVKQIKSILEIIVRVMKLKSDADLPNFGDFDLTKLFDNVDTVVAIANESIVVRNSESDSVVSVEELDLDQLMDLFPTILEVNQCFLEPLVAQLAKEGVISAP